MHRCNVDVYITSTLALDPQAEEFFRLRVGNAGGKQRWNGQWNRASGQWLSSLYGQHERGKNINEDSDIGS